MGHVLSDCHVGRSLCVAAVVHDARLSSRQSPSFPEYGVPDDWPGDGQSLHARWRAAFWVTTLFTIVAASFDLMMLTRFNQTLWSFLPFMSNKVTWFCTEQSCTNGGYRLDDMFSFLIGLQALKPIADTLDSMPSTVLLSKLCPAGVETTLFAMLAAIMNLGLTLSGLLAGFFLGDLQSRYRGLRLWVVALG